jgi:hypothetical protein
MWHQLPGVAYIQSIVPGTIPMAIPTPTPIKMGNVSGHVPH